MPAPGGAIPTRRNIGAGPQTVLTRELIERNNGGIVHKLLGGRLKQAIEDKEQSDAAGLKLLRELQTIVVDLNESQAEPDRLGLKEPGELRTLHCGSDVLGGEDEALAIRATKAMNNSGRSTSFRLFP